MKADQLLRIPGLCLLLLLLSVGCGGGGAAPPPPPPPSFTISVSPSSLLAAQTTTSVPMTVTVNPTNGFTGTVNVTISGLPTGVNPSTNSPFTLAAGGSQMVTFTVGPTVGRANYALTFSGSSGTISNSVAATLTVSGAPLTATTGNFKPQVIYQIVTDRFFDGDPTNDDPPQSKGLFDPTRTNFQMYWGGDFAGIQQKMAYLAGMGITAIWISPPVDNIHVAANFGGSQFAPFHGFWARDMKRIEEHFGDASNGWTAFDSMVTAAHQNGIRVIVDFAPNHSNPNDAGEMGALLDAGQPFASYLSDPLPPNNLFHHNPTITNFNDPYQLQYFTLDDLADLNQNNASIDKYLKDSMQQFQAHGVDAFRIDAVKHAIWGWDYSFANVAFSTQPTFLFGEWAQGSTSDPLYFDSHKFANHSGISLLDFPLSNAMRDVFANNGDFREIDNTITAENADFSSPNDLVTFVDSHDLPRLLSVNNNQNRLNEALALLLACRGIPVVLYGDEQYLHNDTNGGNDPYNRIFMSTFGTQTTAYQLIDQMAQLRQNNPALAYGTSQQRWINSDVYILERQFFGDVALIAVNKSETTSYNITGLLTALAPGNYADYLNGLLGGFAITVTNGNGNNPVTAFPLSPHTVAVWQAAPAAVAPQVGSIGPLLGQSGTRVTIAGQGFGAVAGKVMFGSTSAVVGSWSDSTVSFSVPSVTPGSYSVQLITNSGAAANTIPFTVLTGPLIPVTFTVNNVPAVAAGAGVFLTGNVVELGGGSTTRDAAIGPLLSPNPPTYFIDASVPSGTTVSFQFAIIAANGMVTMEPGPPHMYTVPSSGVGSVTVNW
jgi:glycosidase